MVLGRIQDIPEELMPTIDEFTGDLFEVAEIVGVPKALELAQRFKGSYVYFRSVDNILRKKRNKDIREDYDRGISVPRLARKYSLCERQVWNVLGQAG